MTARQAKAEAMERVEANANPVWLEQMFYAVVVAAATKEFFTSDDVFELAKTTVTETTHDLRAFGPVMHRAAREGFAKKARKPPTLSARRSNHARPLTVWQSTIFLKRKKRRRHA